MGHIPGRLVHFAHDHHLAARFFGAALAAMTFAVVAEQASAHSGVIEDVLKAHLKVGAPQIGDEDAPRYTTVFEGVDLDGDGAADFVNPTGQEVRKLDAFGYGHYGASRDGGSRSHAGVDYAGVAGQEVKAPISGRVTRHGYAYGMSDPDLKLVEIVNDALGISAKVLYINPTVNPGEFVQVGETVGTLETLQHRYAGITDHVHLEIKDHGERLNTEDVIVARRVRIELLEAPIVTTGLDEDRFQIASAAPGPQFGGRQFHASLEY